MSPFIFVTILISLLGGICIGGVVGLNINCPKRKIQNFSSGLERYRIEYSEPLGGSGRVDVYDGQTSQLLSTHTVWRLEE